MTEKPSSGGHKPRPSDEDLSNALPRRTGSNEARVGIFVIFGLIALVAVLFLLTDPATMRGRYMLVTTVLDAGGVRRGDPVQMRGVIIGRINGFEMMPSGRVAVRLGRALESSSSEGRGLLLPDEGFSVMGFRSHVQGGLGGRAV